MLDQYVLETWRERHTAGTKSFFPKGWRSGNSGETNSKHHVDVIIIINTVHTRLCCASFWTDNACALINDIKILYTHMFACVTHFCVCVCVHERESERNGTGPHVRNWITRRRRLAKTRYMPRAADQSPLAAVSIQMVSSGLEDDVSGCLAGVLCRRRFYFY